MGANCRERGKLALCGILLTVGIFVSAPIVAATDFLRFVEDLPLVPGLVEDTTASVILDKPDGRIVRTRASGRLSRATVISFYRRTLPQLGWQLETKTANLSRNRITGLSFVRPRETLSLEVGTDGHNIVVHFAITPR